MKKLKKFVMPSLYTLIIAGSFLSISLMNNKIEEVNNEDYNYSKSLIKEVTQVVYGEVEEQKFIKPIVSEKPSLVTSFYSKEDESEKQQASLIYYEHAYLPSSGVIYSSDEEFDVVSVYDGKVTEVKEDEILGTHIAITHNNSLTTYYYSLKDLAVKEGDEVVQGTILGKSNSNKIYDKNALLFEVYFDGHAINPEAFYEAKPSDLQ